MERDFGNNRKCNDGVIACRFALPYSSKWRGACPGIAIESGDGMVQCIDKLYKEYCVKELSKYGFRRYGKNYWRISEGIFQSFCLHKSVSGENCTVEFVVKPLCSEHAITKNTCGSNHLKMFENEYSWFEYDRQNEQSIYSCVEEMIMYMKRYLIPYFERTTSAKDAYHEIKNFQREHYKEGILWSDRNLYNLALKSGLYDEAELHLVAYKEHITKAFKTNSEYLSDDEEYIQSMEEAIRQVELELIYVQRRDLNFIQNYITVNETLSLKNLGLI